MSNKTLVRGLSAAAILAILTGAAYGDVDETGVTPKHWYRFDNYKTSSGATEVSWGGSEQGSASNCIASDMGKAYKTVNGSAHPWGSSLQLGSGAYTIVISAKAPENATAGKKAPMFVIGGYGEGIGLFADPTDASTATTKSVSLLVWGNAAASSETGYATVATFETDIATKYHSYAIVANAGTYTLYVDGVSVGSYTGRAWTGSKNFQIGGVNGGFGGKLPASGFNRVSDVHIDDFRVYQEAVSADKLTTISTLKYSINESGAIDEVTSGTYGVSVGTTRDLSGLTLPTITAPATVAAGATMTTDEAKTGTATFTNVPAGITSISYAAGTEVVSLPVTEGTATFSSALGIVDGNATVFDISFKNNKADIGKAGGGGGYFTYNRPGAGNLKWDTAATFTKGANDEWDDTVGCLIKTHPYIDGAAGAFNTALNSQSGCSIVVVGQMSPTKNTQFINIGSSDSGRGSLLIATTETPNQVMIATAQGSTVNTATAVYATIPNAASSRHAYVITRQGDVMTVYADGTKRGQITLPSNFALGNSGHCGIQVGSDFGGTIKNGTYKSVAVNDSETGAVNVIRIYDYILSDKQSQAVFSAYPYVSENGLFTRTITGDVNLIEEEATWTNDKTKEAATVPAEGASMTITVDGDSSMTLNAKQATETLTIGGSGTLTIKAGTYPVTPAEEGDPTTAAGEITASDAAIINTPVVIPYGTLKLAGTPVTLGANGSLSFDCSEIDISEVMETTTYQLTGLIDQADEKVTVTLPKAAHRHAVKAYKDGAYVVEVTVDTKTLTIPTYEHTSYTVAVNGVQKSVTNNEIAVPYGAEVTVTYQGSTGYHIVGENTKSTTIDKVVEDSAVGSVTFETAINVYTIAVESIANASASYSINSGERIAVVDGVVSIPHGSGIYIYFTPNDGYTLSTENQDVTHEDDGSYSIHYSNVAASVGTAYATGLTAAKTPAKAFADAINAADDGATVTLGESITLSKCIDVEAADKSITIDLGGYTITPTATCGNGSAFDVKSGTVTIKNGTIDGSAITQTADDRYDNECDAITVRSGANVTLEGLTVKVNSITGSCAYPFNGATLTVLSGTYTNASTTEGPARELGMCFNQADVATQAVFVKGGSMSKDPALGDNSGNCTSFLAEGYVSTLTEGLYVVTEKPTPTRPSVIEGGSTEQQSAYDKWAKEAGDLSTLSDAQIIDRFIFNVGAETPDKDLEDALDDVIEKTDCFAKLMAEIAKGTDPTAYTFTLEVYPNATFKFVPATLGEGVTTSASLFRLTATFVPANN